MPRPPPRPLQLPELVSDARARAEYIQSHPPLYTPSTPSSRPTSGCSNAPPSPSSMTGVNSHRASAATLASSGSPVTPASTHTSLSIHNAPWISDLSKRITRTSGGLLPTPASIEDSAALAGSNTGAKKPRASWSSAIASTKSWFGNSTTTDTKDANLAPGKKPGQMEIKLSPSMIAAHAVTSPSPRPMSSPYPAATDPPPISPTGSTFSASRPSRVGSGLRYYTERDPAPAGARVQIPNPIDPQDHDPRPTPPPGDLNGVTPTLTTFAQLSIESKNQASSKASSEGEARGPPSPPPTPPNLRDSDVPDIKVSSGDDL